MNRRGGAFPNSHHLTLHVSLNDLPREELTHSLSPFSLSHIDFKGNSVDMKEKNKLDMSKVIGTEKKQLNSRNDTLHPHKLKIIV